jgi:ATP-dependent RNA helicase RhlE
LILPNILCIYRKADKVLFFLAALSYYLIKTKLMSFNQLAIIEPILRALNSEGYLSPTLIQQRAIPELLKGKDLLGCAQTGTGKTAAFSIPLLQLIHNSNSQDKTSSKKIQGLILTPTRELAIQIGESISAYSKFLSVRHTVIFGGVSQHMQVKKINHGVDILVATPGRLLDLMQQGIINLQHIRFFVLDEADRMLDMGFINDIKRVIVKLPPSRQTLFFSATMPPDIQRLADTLLSNPVKVTVAPVSSTVDVINQSVYHVKNQDKMSLLIQLLADSKINSLLIFTQMKHAANKLAKKLNENNLPADAIHGNKSQNARQLALENFKKGKIRVLVATDIAARGIDINDLGYVLNFDLPNVPETYVHRIGRTGRAGSSGIAFSFVDPMEKPFLLAIEKLIRKQIPSLSHDFEIVSSEKAPLKKIPSVRAYQKDFSIRKFKNKKNTNGRILQ